ncbi:MAG: hypothetical protein LQ344_002049 [Seirophora lacunosa]|nr:MAG: hypothetical protein LQ344_002049 [Seirophora lacunosa]
MEDAPPHTSEELYDDDAALSQRVMATSMDDAIKQEVAPDAHDMLRRVAQDATSQAEGDAMEVESTSARETVQEQALMNGRTSEEAALTNNNFDDPMHQPIAEGDAFGVPSAYSNHDQHSQIDLTNGSSNLIQADMGAMLDDPTLETAASVVESEPPRIQAFAKLEFDDGEFYMNTYSVELGRDIRAARQAYGRDAPVLQQQINTKVRKRSSSSGNLSRSSSKVQAGHGRHLSGSVISETGGIMGLDHSDSDGPRQRKGKKSKSATSSSQQLSRKSSMNFPGTRTDYQSLAMASLLDPSADAQLVDPGNSLPSPESCPLVPIHPPASTDGVPTSHKSISRKHIKIAFNFEKHLFEVIVLGRNGAFVDEEWYPEGDVQELRSGSLIQIGGVGIRFLLPDVALGETGAENTQSSDPASFGLENGNTVHGELGEGSDEESDERDEDENESRDDSDEDESEESDQSNEASEEETRGRSRRRERDVKPTPANRPVRTRKPVRGKEPPKAKPTAKATLKLKTKEEPEAKIDGPTPPPKRKGPGRPPKNGIISKREQALQARQAKEAAKAAAQSVPDAPPGRGKGKSIPAPREASQENNNLQPNGKRKYKKRKTKAEMEAGEQQGVRESTERTNSVPPHQNAAPPPKPAKPMKAPKPPRSPSPIFDEASLTAEQLAKPQSSYVILIHEALSNSKTGQMSLPQIYRAIERKYPFYKLRVQTTGWQSSVRHNLSQHPAFRKIERDGKGWMWGLVPEISIEKEKKRRMTPPPVAAGAYYPPPQMVQPPPYPYSAMPPANPHMPYPPYASYPGLPRPYPPPPAHFPPQQPTLSLPPALANAQVDTSSTYQSPYATGPSQSNPDTAPPQASAPNGPNAPSSPFNITTSAPTTSIPNAPPPPPAPAPAQASPFSTHTPINSIPASATHSPEVLAVVKKFKDFLLSSLSGNPSAESLINGAIDRVLNKQQQQQPAPSPPSSSPSNNANANANANATPGEDDHQEKAIMRILQSMLDGIHARSASGEGGEAAGTNTGAGAGTGTDKGKAREGSTFFQILESVNQQGGEGGVLPLPPAAKPAVQLASGAGKAAGSEGEGSAGVGVGREATGEGGVFTPFPPPREEVEGRGSMKRPLDDEDDGDDAMDARPRAAKRIAT